MTVKRANHRRCQDVIKTTVRRFTLSVTGGRGTGDSAIKLTGDSDACRGKKSL